MNGKAPLAWQLYSQMDSSHESFNLLQLIANDCYKMGSFYYAAKAFDVLERLDPDPEYWEGKRGACVGVFQQVGDGSARSPARTRARARTRQLAAFRLCLAGCGRSRATGCPARGAGHDPEHKQPAGWVAAQGCVDTASQVSLRGCTRGRWSTSFASSPSGAWITAWQEWACSRTYTHRCAGVRGQAIQCNAWAT